MIDRETNPRVSGAAGWLGSWPRSRQKPGNPPIVYRTVLHREIGSNAAGSIHVIFAVDSARVEPSSFLRARDEPTCANKVPSIKSTAACRTEARTIERSSL